MMYIANVVRVVAQQIPEANVANEIGLQDQSVAQFLLNADVHLDGTWGPIILRDETVARGIGAIGQSLSQEVAIKLGSRLRGGLLVKSFHVLDQGGDIANALPADSGGDRKSTRLNSSHVAISYAVFCLKKK